MVWRRDLYLKEGLTQLESSPNSSLFYSKVKCNPFNSFNKAILTTIKDEIEANILPANATSLVHLHPTAPTFYMLPKIHKQQTPVPGQKQTADTCHKDSQTADTCPCPTSQIAKFLDAILSLLVEQQPTYIKDSNHAINIFSTFCSQGEHCFLFSMDVKSLYTSIPHEDGLTLLALGGGVFHIDFVCLLITILVLGRFPPNLMAFHNWVLAKFSISKIKIDVSLLPW